LKEQFLPLYAQRFQAAGYGVLLYDHRNWGQSDGAPRNETNPIQQARDYSDAFDKAASLEEVDETKIVYWGTSMSGGAVLHAAAFDNRIKAVIAQVPFVSGEAIGLHLDPVFESIHAGRQEHKSGKPPPLLKLFPENTELAEQGDQSALINDPNLSGFLGALGDLKPSWSPNQYDRANRGAIRAHRV
jgi:pimeloyl-ACP methyl ester carboxylesterase